MAPSTGGVRALRHRDPVFSACGMLVGSHDRGIEHYSIEAWLLEGFEDRLLATLLRPAVEALVDRVVFAKAFRQVGPGRSSARDSLQCARFRVLQ